MTRLEHFKQPDSMKPIIIIPPGEINSTNLEMLRKNGLCVVVAKHPEKVKFIDPIPAASSRTQMEDAAIKLSRKIMAHGFWNTPSTRDEMCRCFIDLLVEGTPLDPRGTQEEREREIFNQTKRDELCRLARQEAKEEREAAKTKAAKPIK